MVTGKSEGQTHVSVIKKKDGAVKATVALAVLSKPASPILLSLGKRGDVPPEWNIITEPQSQTEGFSINNLVNTDLQPSGVKMTLTERFNGMNSDGPFTTNTPLDLPQEVSNKSLFGNPDAGFNGQQITQSTLEFDGLNSGKTYEFCFYAGRMNVGDNRDTKFILKGATQETTSLNTSNNDDKIVCAEVKPDGNGKIILTVTKGDSNNNGSGFYYIGAIRIKELTD